MLHAPPVDKRGAFETSHGVPPRLTLNEPSVLSTATSSRAGRDAAAAASDAAPSTSSSSACIIAMHRRGRGPPSYCTVGIPCVAKKPG